jgi:hypothetical protein
MHKLSIVPSLVFISEDEWKVSGFQDSYLKTMIDAFNQIQKSNLNVIWSEKLEELLWISPHYKPWSSLSQRNSLVPVFYKMFRKNIELINHSNEKSSSIPNIEHKDKVILDEFYSILNQLIVDGIDYSLFKSDNQHQFLSKCRKEYIPKSCNSCFDILKLNLKLNLFEGTIIEQINNLKQIIDIYLSDSNIEKLNTYNFSNTFIKRIKTINDKDLITLIQRISLRIGYTSQESRACTTLRDEFITTNGINEHRIRISNRPTSIRVHYIIKENTLEFLNYYGNGEHDDRL